MTTPYTGPCTWNGCDRPWRVVYWLPRGRTAFVCDAHSDELVTADLIQTERERADLHTQATHKLEAEAP